MTRRLILATASRYKRSLLERLALEFEADAADIDETPQPGEAPDALARRLARAKARAVHTRHPEAFVLGADQVIALGDELLSKPGTPEGARAQLRRLSGRTHRLIATVALATPDGRLLDDTTVFEMVMRPLSDAEIAAYVDDEMPVDCAGAYKIEAGGIRLFRAMRGDDFTAIIGLPLTRVHHLLEEAGYFST